MEYNKDNKAAGALVTMSPNAQTNMQTDHEHTDVCAVPSRQIDRRRCCVSPGSSRPENKHLRRDLRCDIGDE